MVGGVVANYGEDPWNVVIYRDVGSERILICGGTLVSQTMVISGKHTRISTPIIHVLFDSPYEMNI